MDPNDISLDNLTKSFEYAKLSSQIDSCDDREELRNIAKCFCKLYYKQQETMHAIGIPNGI
jgi:ferredoxin-thioredoxin reductase catalytic subunit